MDVIVFTIARFHLRAEIRTNRAEDITQNAYGSIVQHPTAILCRED